MRQVDWRDAKWRVRDVVIPAIPTWSFWDAWQLGEFEPDTLDAVDRFVTANSTLIDIGAWIGPVSLWAARIGARVIAIEPDPAACACLRDNVNANYPDITVLEAAISNTTGTCHIESHSDGWGSSMTHLASDGLEVPSITVPDLFDRFKIDDCSLVKMDIEGGEALVLETVAPFLASLGIPLLVAMHQPWWSRPVDSAWFNGYSHVEGVIGGWHTVLAVP